MALGLLPAQDEHPDGHQNEGEERADVGHLGERADVEQARGDGDQDSRDDGGEPRRAEARVDGAELVRQQAVARHGKPDARLAVLADQDGRDHAEDGTDEYEQPNVVQAVRAGLDGEPLEGVDDGRAVAGDGVPFDQAGERE